MQDLAQSTKAIVDLSQQLTALNGQLTRMMDAIEVVKKQQDEISQDISKIKEAVYNPDEGLYARLRNLEQWKATTTRVQWIVISTIVALAAKAIIELIMPGAG